MMTETWRATGNTLPNNTEGELTERQQFHVDHDAAVRHLGEFAERGVNQKCCGCCHVGIIAGSIGIAAIRGQITEQQAEVLVQQIFDSCPGAVYERDANDARPICPPYESGDDRRLVKDQIDANRHRASKSV